MRNSSIVGSTTTTTVLLFYAELFFLYYNFPILSRRSAYLPFATIACSHNFYCLIILPAILLSLLLHFRVQNELLNLLSLLCNYCCRLILCENLLLFLDTISVCSISSVVTTTCSNNTLTTVCLFYAQFSQRATTLSSNYCRLRTSLIPTAHPHTTTTVCLFYAQTIPSELLGLHKNTTACHILCAIPLSLSMLLFLVAFLFFNRGYYLYDCTAHSSRNSSITTTISSHNCC